nr:MAG TPA_asm: hypothetical protein [Caudoviricetes sp.]
MHKVRYSILKSICEGEHRPTPGMKRSGHIKRRTRSRSEKNLCIALDSSLNGK